MGMGNLTSCRVTHHGQPPKGKEIVLSFGDDHVSFLIDNGACPLTVRDLLLRAARDIDSHIRRHKDDHK